MPANTFGPFGPGVNPTTEQPAYDDAAQAGAVDTWFKACVGNDPATGTKITERFLNFVLDNLRLACRGMGVPDSAIDKLLLLKAIQKADRQIINTGDGAEVYAGLDEDGKHQLRTMNGSPGLDIAVNEETGEIDFLLSPGAVSIDNLGTGIEVYGGEDGGTHLWRTMLGVNGIDVRLSESGDEVVVDGAGIRGEITIRQQQLYTVGSHTNSSPGAQQQAWTEIITPKAVGNKLTVKGSVYHYMSAATTAEHTGTLNLTRTLKLEWQKNGSGSWTEIDSKYVGATIPIVNPSSAIYGTFEDAASVDLMGQIVIPSDATSINVRIRHNAGQVVSGRVEVMEFQYAA